MTVVRTREVVTLMLVHAFFAESFTLCKEQCRKMLMLILSLNAMVAIRCKANETAYTIHGPKLGVSTWAYPRYDCASSVEFGLQTAASPSMILRAATECYGICGRFL